MICSKANVSRREPAGDLVAAVVMDPEASVVATVEVGGELRHRAQEIRGTADFLAARNAALAMSVPSLRLVVLVVASEDRPVEPAPPFEPDARQETIEHLALHDVGERRIGLVDEHAVAPHEDADLAAGFVVAGAVRQLIRGAGGLDHEACCCESA